MKTNLFLLFIFLLVSTISCTKEINNSNEEIELSAKLEKMTEIEVEKYAESIGAITLEQLLKETKAKLIHKEDSNTIGYREKITSDIYTVKGYNGKVTLFTNQKVIIRNSPLGLISGVYFVDSYEIRNKATLPVGSLGVTMPSEKCGFDPQQEDHEAIGCRMFGQTGNTFYMRTIAYYVNCNNNDRKVKLWYPTLSTLEWNYGYIN